MERSGQDVQVLSTRARAPRHDWGLIANSPTTQTYTLGYEEWFIDGVSGEGRERQTARMIE